MENFNNIVIILNFYHVFSYISVDIVELEKKDKDKKKQFLEELKALVDKYSQEDTGIDLYE